MIFGRTTKEKERTKKDRREAYLRSFLDKRDVVFMWRPRKLSDGRWVWLHRLSGFGEYLTTRHGKQSSRN